MFHSATGWWLIMVNDNDYYMVNDNGYYMVNI